MRRIILITLALCLGSPGCHPSDSPIDGPCRNKSHCLPGLKCGDGVCYDPNVVQRSPGGKARYEATKEAERGLARAGRTCAETQGCITHGACSQNRAGSCVPSLSLHCENATVSCKQGKRCVYVEAKQNCCKDETGKSCSKLPKLPR